MPDGGVGGPNPPSAMTISKRQTVHWLFDFAVMLKALNGLLEVVAGYFLVFKPGWVGFTTTGWATTLLFNDPDSHLAKMLAQWSAGWTTDTERFAASYLIAHGAAKAFIAWGLVREKRWAFPTGLVVFALLILFQIDRIVHSHSLVLAVLIGLDAGVLYLIWREWSFRRDAAAHPVAAA